jgi:UDP-N-acetylmuramate--alanine ligase
MDISRYSHIFMPGIGGIGMSALARYFHLMGKTVAGYDRVGTSLTRTLEGEGISIIYQDDPDALSNEFKNKDHTLIIFTPAIKEDNLLLQYFTRNDFIIRKRADMLGLITSLYKTIAVGGTHGKTTISTMIAHLLYQSEVGCTALLGGISKNYKTNFLFSETSYFAVTEADEFDRSFLKLHPQAAVITSIDPDHLDIYNTAVHLKASYEAFAGQVNQEGFLLLKHDINLNPDAIQAKKIYTYALEDSSADIHAKNISIDVQRMQFDLVIPGGIIAGLKMEPTGLMNLENAVAAAYIALQAGATEDEIKNGLASFAGVQRRFDVQYNDGKLIYIDDYAHHPEEINALISSAKSVFPEKMITGIFQPHLYSRTRDFADEFAVSLQALDEVVVLPLYPAREKPIKGVSSDLILEKISGIKKSAMTMEEAVDYFFQNHFEILLTIGAGNIDTLVEPLKQMIISKTSKPARS